MFYLVYHISTAMKGEFVSSMMFPCQKLFLYLSQPWKLGIALVNQTLRFRKDNKHIMCNDFLHNTSL